MIIQQNISLKKFNSFSCDVNASNFTTIHSTEQLIEALDWCNNNKMPFIILGAGSNILFTKQVDALVLKIEIKGIQKTNETSSAVYLSVGAGENWHNFVSYCVQKSWGGIENLSLIPGTVGAAPIQNIGAYGVEVKETIANVTAYDTLTNQWVTIYNIDCDFGYRTSLFKKEKNRFIICKVDFYLQKQPSLRTAYGAIREVLHQKNIQNPSLVDVSNAIIQIRTQKLPDPKIVGNAGSFFKNPTVSKEVFEQLKLTHVDMMAFPISDLTYKLAAGWLIEHSGFKGYRKGAIGCYEKQALVIVNYGNGTGKEILAFSEEIINAVYQKFGVHLETEVNIY